MNEGRLPKPRAQPSAKAMALLALYDRAEAGEREGRALLQFEITRAEKKDLADYYAGVRARLEAIETVPWPDGYEEETT